MNTPKPASSFAMFFEEIKAEAQAAGPDAVVELAAKQEKYRAAAQSPDICLDKCPVLKQHHPVKIKWFPRPDTEYWCTGCGVTGLAAPNLKSWEDM